MVGRHCSVGDHSVIERAVLHDSVIVGAECLLTECIVAEGVRVAEGAQVRPGAVLGSGATIARGAEVERGARIPPGEQVT